MVYFYGDFLRVFFCCLFGYVFRVGLGRAIPGISSELLYWIRLFALCLVVGRWICP